MKETINEKLEAFIKESFPEGAEFLYPQGDRKLKIIGYERRDRTPSSEETGQDGYKFLVPVVVAIDVYKRWDDYYGWIEPQKSWYDVGELACFIPRAEVEKLWNESQKELNWLKRSAMTLRAMIYG